MPYKTCFIDDPSTMSEAIDWLVDVLFLTDIFINFISALEEKDGTITTDLKTIANDYLKSWFIFDVISCIPFQLLEKVFMPSVKKNGPHDVFSK